jgi:toxin ParE1/3/4
MASDGFEIVVTRHALLDIEEITGYIAEVLHNKKAAKDFTSTLRQRFRTLVDAPYLYPKSRMQELAVRGYRSFLVKNYLVFYLVDENIRTVIIARIIYGSRDYVNLILER